MAFSTEMIVAIISLVVAFGSTFFAWRATKVAEKTYGVELIGQLYTLYQSNEMLENLKIVWDIYKQLWIEESNSKEVGITKANNGVPIELDNAIRYFNSLKVESKEFKAIHYIINFWTYLELLIKRKVLTKPELSAFTSPYILGFLVPIAKAYDLRYPDPDENKTHLEYAYKKLVTSQSKNFWISVKNKFK